MDIKSPRYLVLFAIKSPFHWVSIPSCASYKGDWILQDILTLVLLPKKAPYCSPEQKQLFTVKGGKFKISAQRRDLAPFFGNGDFICTVFLLIFLSFTFWTSMFRNQLTISSEYFDMVCYLSWEASSGPISFNVEQYDNVTDNIQSFELPF